MNMNIWGTRQSGKTSVLVNSMLIHLTDPSLPENVALISSACSISSSIDLGNRLIEKLRIAKVKFSCSQSKIITTITVGKRICNIVPPQQNFFIGKKFDYVFLDNYDFFDSGFKKFIDVIIRPNVVIIQTQEGESTYMKDIECKY